MKVAPNISVIGYFQPLSLLISAHFSMNYQKRVVEATPQIHINQVKNFVSHRSKTTELTLTIATGEVIPYSAPIATSPCYFGGVRLWFKCEFCGGKAGILYANEAGTQLSCRSCSNLVYRNQRLSSSSRQLMRYFDMLDKAEAVFDGLQRLRFLHKGQPTRRFKRYLAYSKRINGLSRALLG